MKVILRIIAVLLVISAFWVYRYKAKPPVWKTTVLDTKHPMRFVDIALYEGEPLIVFFNEQEGGGVLYQKAKTNKLKFLGDLDYYRNNGQREWENGVVDEGPNVGMFISMDVGQKVNLAYQDGTLGKERLIYATLSGSGRTDSPGVDVWQKETVDDAQSSGINVGMYASVAEVEGKPVIFYHTEQGQKFNLAARTGGTWEKKVIDKGVGWLTSNAVCNGKVYVGYRGRDNQEIYLGTLENDQWSSRQLEASTSGSLAVTTQDCQPYLAYLDEKDSKIKFVDLVNNETFAVGDGKLSRLSLAAAKDGFHAAYYYSDIIKWGLIYAFSRDGREWRTQEIASGNNEGWYNAISADDRGNVYVAYLNSNSLKFAEYNVSSVETIRVVKKITLGVLLTIGAILMILSKPDLKRWTRVLMAVTKKMVRTR